MEGDRRAAGDSRKRTRREQATPVDRLSVLSDSLLLHILSFLRIEDVISTALLSRRWRHLWTSTPCLDFYCRPTQRSSWLDCVKTAFIDRTLILHEGTKIRTFRATFNPYTVLGGNLTHAEISKRADSWVRLAVRRRVEELALHYRWRGNPYSLWRRDDRYILPVCVFSCESLVSLTLGYCRLELPSRISMSSLRILTLCRVTIGEDDNLQGLLAGCPSLEYLALEDFVRHDFGGIRVEGSNSRLRTLTIRDNNYRLDTEDHGILISAPSIKELVFKGCWKAYYAKEPFTSIVTASLDLQLRPDEFCHGPRGFARLLRDLRHVKALKLSRGCVQALCVEMHETEFDIISLELNVGFVTSEIHRIFIALRSFTKLEFLTINLTGESGRIISCTTPIYSYSYGSSESADKEMTDVTSNERSSATMLHLKTATIFGLVREICREEENGTIEEMPEKYRNGLEFIRFLLKNSPVLERLAINAVDHVNKLTKRKSEILFRFASRLLALPRASPNALVIIRDE